MIMEEGPSNSQEKTAVTKPGKNFYSYRYTTVWGVISAVLSQRSKTTSYELPELVA